MSTSKEKSRRRVVRLQTALAASCPSCNAHLTEHPAWCAQCRFTGGDTMQMFAGPPPPLPPILDAAGLWNERQLKAIASSRRKIEKRFPQFHWKICTVRLAPADNLNLFSFWMLNASPLASGESEQDRCRTILHLIDEATGNATITPGYLAEVWLSEEEWKTALASMQAHWSRGKTTHALAEFFTTSRDLLLKAWRRNRFRHA